MTQKFKVGDKVRCTAADMTDGEVQYGGIYTVTRAPDKHFIAIEKSCWLWNINLFELVGEQQTITREDQAVKLLLSLGYTLKKGE